MSTTNKLTIITALFLSTAVFTLLNLEAPIPQIPQINQDEGMAIRLRTDKNQYKIGDTITITIDYLNINSYPINFKPPSTYEVKYGYRDGRSSVLYNGIVGGSISPPSLVGRVYTVKGRGVFTLWVCESPAEREGVLYLNYLGYVKVLRISE